MRTFVAAVTGFGRDAWNLSAERIRRADPLLMGAAIAYNSLFALVPLAVSFVAILSFVDKGGSVIANASEVIGQAFPAELAAFLIGILEQASGWAEGLRGPVLVISLMVALWSGSRAVYAVQKALRAVEASVDQRGYVRSRSVGIVVTVGAAIGVLVAYTFLTIGSRIWAEVAAQFGQNASVGAQVLSMTIAIVWVWLLLWAIYRWGPPAPLPHASVVAALVAGLLVVGSVIAFDLFPATSNTLAVLGSLSIFLVWLYYLGIVVVAAPTVFNAIAGATRNLMQR
jgi:uncharacterized BrkB/YihY/UPF0761 family membrane protein